MIRILVVDHQQLIRQCLRVVLERQAGLSVVGDAGTHVEAVEQVTLARPDVVLLNLDHDGEKGFALIADLRVQAPDARIVVLAEHNSPEQHRRAVLVGAVGLVLKTHSLESLVQAIERVHMGQAWLDNGLVANIVGELSRPRNAPPVDPELAKIALLSERERMVIRLVCEGLQNREIAGRMALSETTVRHHLTAIFAKLEVDHRQALVIYAFRNGLAALPGAGG